MSEGGFPLETVEELRRLVVEYALCLDLRRYDDIAGLFTPDGFIDFRPQGRERYEGHDAINAMYTGLHETIESCAHFVTNFFVTKLEGDHAESLAYTIGHAWFKGVAEPRRDMVYYQDTFRRLPDVGWRFAGRVVPALTKYDSP
jgi:hypothetical protein